MSQKWILEDAEYAILNELIKRKRKLSLKLLEGMLRRYKIDEIKSWLTSMGMRGLVKHVEEDGALWYTATVEGFQAWDNHLPF